MPEHHPVIANDLTKSFGDFTAVHGVDFAVEQGEVFGFLGPNGAGKSSTMRMIGAVSPVTSGSLTVFGLDPPTHTQQADPQSTRRDPTGRHSRSGTDR